jgi:perosamine synthetase
VNQPDLGEAEEASVVAALRSGWVTTGAAVDELESRFARLVGRAHAVAVSSGTTALEAALVGLRVASGDLVLTQSFVCDAVANAVYRVTGRAPLVVDVEPETWSLATRPTAGNLEAWDREGRLWPFVVALERGVKAVILAHTYGVPARDLIEVRDRCRVRQVPLIEDCSEAHGAMLDGHHVGAFGDVAIWSMRGEKTLSAGQLGIVLSDDANVRRRAYQYAHNGLPSAAVRFWSSMAAGNAQPANLNAALACAQLSRLDELRDARTRVHDGWVKRLGHLVGFQAVHGDPCWWLTAVTLDGFTQMLPQDLSVALRERGIETRTGFYGLHMLPHCEGSALGPCPVTEGLIRRVLILPSGPRVTEADQDYVVRHLLDITGRGEA